jgi:DNA-binding MarR family transcriptional regulator
MREAGWIRNADRPDEARRRLHEITPLGRALLSAELSRLERLLDQARPALAHGKATS